MAMLTELSGVMATLTELTGVMATLTEFSGIMEACHLIPFYMRLVESKRCKRTTLGLHYYYVWLVKQILGSIQ